MSANIPNDPVAIQRFFTSRDNNANASTYVGQEQRLWYNPVTNAIYVSDGNTAGGIPVGTATGNGIPIGPAYSVQYNAGGGDFGGTSNVVISGDGISVVGNVTAGAVLTNNYLYANGDSIFTNAAFTGNVSLGNLYIIDETIYGRNINANIGLSPEGSGWVTIPKLAIDSSTIAYIGGKLQIATPVGVDLQFAPGTTANILTSGNIFPTANNIAALGDPSHRYTGLWIGSGNINLTDTALGTDQQIYASNGNLIIANSTGAQFGNFRFFSNTMALANAAANLIVGTANATGWVQFNRAIDVQTTVGSTAFSVNKDGLTNIFVPGSIGAQQSALNIVGSSSGNSQPRSATFTGTLLQLTGQDNLPARVSIDAFGATGAQNSYASIASRVARGNVDTPAPLQTNDLMMRLTNQGWTGNGYAASIARFNFAAAENFTSNAAVGTYANIQLTPIGSNVIKTVTSFNANGVGFPNAISGGTGNLGITFQDGSYQSTAYIASNVVNSVTVNLGLSQNQTTGAITIDNTGVLAATGTPQQVRVNGSYTVPQTGNIVLALPQDIATNSTVTFGNITITGNLFVTGNTVSGNTIGINGKILYLANNSTGNTAINFGGIALGNVDESYSRTILYDLDNNRWTTAGSANNSGTSNFYSPVLYSANVATDYLDVTYTGHFGTAYDGLDFAQASIQAYADTPTYAQIVNWNKNQGSSASTDFVAVNNLGNTTNDIHYIDLGINSNTYANTDYAVSGPNDGYLYINGGNLIIGTQTAGNVIKFHTGGTGNVNLIRAIITDAGLSVAGNVDGANVNSVALIKGATVSATGSVVSQNVYSLNNINAVGSVTAQALVANTTISASGTITGGNLRTAAGGFISTTGNVYAGNLVTTTTTIDGGVSTTGNVTAANVVTSGTVSALGNINAPNLNASLAVISTLLSVTGNIDGGNIRTSGTISTTGTAIFGNVQTTGVVSSTGNIDGGNIRTGGLVVGTTVSATGNIIGSYIFGNGSQLTGLNAFQTVTANGTNLLATSTSGVLTVTPGNNLVITGNSVTDTMTVAVANSPTFSGNVSDANGQLRSLPINTQGSAYTLTANDNGNLISISSGNVTVPASVFASPFGQAVTVYNNSGNTRYITQGAGTTLRLAGTAATGNRTLVQYGLSTIVCVSANTFVVSGVGLS